MIPKASGEGKEAHGAGDLSGQDSTRFSLGYEQSFPEFWLQYIDHKIELVLSFKALAMSQTLTLPDELYARLAQVAAERGLTIESLLKFISDLVASPNRPSAQDRERHELLEGLLAKYGTGELQEKDRLQLARLIDMDYQDANARADRVITAKGKRSGSSQATKSRQDKAVKGPRK